MVVTFWRTTPVNTIQKYVYSQYRVVLTQVVKEGRVFYIPGLASFRVEAKKPRVVATACAGRWTRRMGPNVEQVD